MSHNPLDAARDEGFSATLTSIHSETLRDRFAMVAVDMFREETVRAADRKGALKQLAKTAYLFADAMMEARN